MCMSKIISTLTLIFLLGSFKISYCQNHTIETVGDITQLALPATAVAMLIIKKDKKGVWQYAKACGTTILVTRILKEVVVKERPGEAWSFDSFPSGHTSIAFSGASFLQKRYGWKYGIPAYALATFTGYSRVYAKKHDIIDVLAGATIGIGSTYLLKFRTQ